MIFNDFEKLYIYSPSLHQDLHQKLIKCFTNYIPIIVIPSFLSEEDLDLKIDKIDDDKDFEKSEREIETYESIKEFKFPQEYEDEGLIILDDSNVKND